MSEKNKNDGTVLVGRGGKLYKVPADGHRAERSAFVAGQCVGTAAGIGWVPFKIALAAGKELLDGASNTSFGQGVQYGFHTVDRAVDVQIAGVRNRGKDINTIKLELAASKRVTVQEIHNLSESALRKIYADISVPNSWEIDQSSSQPAPEETNSNESFAHEGEHIRAI